MEESTLALVFEERVMPRAGDKADGEGDEADAEGGGGGPEHLVSFEGLMTWPDVQVRLFECAGWTGCQMSTNQPTSQPIQPIIYLVLDSV